ncbi:CobW family GTP-binding protein [Achromobacter aloeverae]|uniref:Cobalamin biosynthesis protein CobW n=1 Tax=Achromobacter aloeverae TaxID=1750518 RepID=A0A4Q1HNK0_9BURK|nr:CobW family GTP-binding protein [Achromobacter aloeverae]RXN91074.1 cobalamin biosynthesis protein CobW [Achromobacter aloeverae]
MHADWSGEAAAPVDLIVLSGFLGSGKTTLLLQYLNDAGTVDTGVIVNEVGEIGVDGVIVADGSDAVPMTLLANGCVCCAMRSSLVDTVAALLDAPRPAGRGPLRRIILETSGVSRPGPIIAALADPELARRRLRVAVVSTYDCVTGALQAGRFDEASAQLAAAQRIVLTKRDLAENRDVARHWAALAGINPLAELIDEEDRRQAARRAFEDTAPAGDGGVAQALAALRATGRMPLDAGALPSLAQAVGRRSPPGFDTAGHARDGREMPGQDAGAARIDHPRVHVLTAALAEGAGWEALALWLDDLSAFCGERLLRVKAVLRVSDCDDPILIQSVGTTFSAPRRLRAAEAADNLFVIITRDLDADAINGMAANGAVSVQAPRGQRKPSLAVGA